jgi:hypothetical protein
VAAAARERAPPWRGEIENASSSTASREEGDWKKAKNGAIIKAKKTGEINTIN